MRETIETMLQRKITLGGDKPLDAAGGSEALLHKLVLFVRKGQYGWRMPLTLIQLSSGQGALRQ